MITVRHGDKYPVTFTAGSVSGAFDLTESTVELLYRRHATSDEWESLTIDNQDDQAGEVTTDAWSELDAGLYVVVVRVTTADGQILTFPTDDVGEVLYEFLYVMPSAA